MTSSAAFPLAPLPDSDAVRAAGEVLRRFCTPAIVAHSERAWQWCVALSRVTGVEPVDRELLCVATLLHDTGLAEGFDAMVPAYEEVGGNVAWAVTAGAGWSPSRRDRVAEVIVRHNWPAVPADEDPDGFLLELATGLDIVGTRASELDDALVDAVLARHPRGDIGSEFAACLRDQAARKPSTQAARLVGAVVAERLARHPHETRRS